MSTGLVLYRPASFSLVDAQTPPPNGAFGIRHIGVQIARALAAGNAVAALCFVDHWLGASARVTPPENRRDPL